MSCQVYEPWENWRLKFLHTMNDYYCLHAPLLPSPDDLLSVEPQRELHMPKIPTAVEGLNKIVLSIKIWRANSAQLLSYKMF